MSRSIEWETSSNESDRIAGDRRRDKRYEISLDVRWKLIRRRKVLDNGVGRTMDLSSGGMLIDAGRPLPVGLNLELSITWPVLLHNTAPLQLVVSGRIVRARGTHAAIRMIQHEFRTIGVAGENRTVMTSPTRSPLPFFGGGSRETMGMAKL